MYTLDVRSLGSSEDRNIRLALFQVHQEAILPLLVVTFVLGMLMFLLTPQFPIVWRAPVIGLFLMVLAIIAALLRGHHYHLCAWTTVFAWIGASAATGWLLAAPSAIALMALAVGLASVFISIRGALGVAILATGLAWLMTQTDGSASITADRIATTVLLWGTLLLGRQSVRPTEHAMNWFWQSYGHARRQLELARDRQGELNQAIKDLADARVQSERLNQLLHASRRAAEEAEHVKSEFVANVSHELRTPLNLILGFAEMMLDAPETYGANLPGRLLADIAAIQRNTEHLSSLVSDVLDMSRAEARRLSLSREWLRPGNVLESAVSAVRPLFDLRGLYLRVRLQDDLPAVYCDRTRIRQVLLNLLGNAGRFTEKGGVTVEVRVEEHHVRFVVHDTGPGIAESELPRIFEPFRQLDGSSRRKHGGSGLGLHISRRFVELHDGEMGAESQVGSGSSFWFTLPLESQPAAMSSPGRWLSGDWEPRRRSQLTPRVDPVPRIVILESHDILYSVACRYLEGIEIEAVKTTEEVREALEAGPAHALLVRGETSEETTRWSEALRDTRFATPVIGCSPAIPSLRDGSQVAGYLTKPITRAELLGKIDSLGGRIETILLTDDESDSLQLFSRLLSSAGASFRVLQASNGHEALELMRMRQPDLLLLDLVMPKMDGFAVLREKAADPKIRAIPVLILSAKDVGDEEILVSSFQVGRGGGLSLVDLLRASLSVSETLMVPRTKLARESAESLDG